MKNNITDDIKGVENIDEVDVSKSHYYPGIQKEGKDKNFMSVADYIHQEQKKMLGNFKIVYRNLKEEVISPYINLDKVPTKIKIEAKDVFYLNAHCFY